ncbi:MAG: class I SAM-dependent methyltransferase [Pseudomonadota bacterium]
MQEDEVAFTGPIAEVYDSVFVPMIFEPYAQDLAGRVAAETPHSVLETTAGNGAVTRALAPQLPSGARYVVTDISAAMLERARALQPGRSRIVWQAASAMALPYGEASFDAVVCQFGAMFFPDRVAGYREARRVLRQGAAFHFNVWDGLAGNGIAHAVQATVADIFRYDPPRFLQHLPYAYGDPDQIRVELAAAGFRQIALSAKEDVSRAPTARHAAAAYCKGTPLRTEIEARDPGALDTVSERVAVNVAQMFGSGDPAQPVAAPMRAFVIRAA